MHLTTLSPPALLGDLLLVWLCHKATVSWGDVLHQRVMTLLCLWMFASKWIKLVGHYIRYPVDVLLLPVSLVFGYFHGAIKMYAVMTLNVVSCIVFLCSSPVGCLSVAPPVFSPMTRQHHNALITTPPSCSWVYPPPSRASPF